MRGLPAAPINEARVKLAAWIFSRVDKGMSPCEPTTVIPRRAAIEGGRERIPPHDAMNRVTPTPFNPVPGEQGRGRRIALLPFKGGVEKQRGRDCTVRVVEALLGAPHTITGEGVVVGMEGEIPLALEGAVLLPTVLEKAG
jgi:hypothetical protein